MSDEFDIQYLDQDECQNIIDWAISAAAMIMIMSSAPMPSNVEETLEKLDGYNEALDIMQDNMPDVLVRPSLEVAEESLEEVRKEEEVVKTFQDELKDL